MHEELPHIVVLSYNETNVENFIGYLKNKFEVLEDYVNSDKYKIRYNDKRRYEKNEEDEGNYIFQNISKIKIVNKYYSADVIISSCIYNKILNVEKEIHIDNIPYESIIFLFDDFNRKEKNIINNNPFRSYNNEDCIEYIKDEKNGNRIRNANFDFSNLYKDIGIKIAIFPLSFQEEKNTDILYFFSEYFIEALYINYNLTNIEHEIPDEQEDNIHENKNENKNKNKNIIKNKFEEFYEDDERLVEALHCNMWKGLQMKKENLIMHEHLENNLQNQDKKEEDKTKNNDQSEDENKTTQNKEVYQNILKADQTELKNPKDKNNIEHKKEEQKKSHVQKEEQKKSQIQKEEQKKSQIQKEEQKKSQIQKEDLFMQNFNKIVEKIKQVKIENTNCNNDNVRRKKAEELILELQQYFCDMDE
ncbi:conserved Plasmodium protein, unknown function [Plasmodium reichenowi]|uniref:Uncharacterized protein n=1 Tax=Plasmodium reichenowi TaxID=5854 RepID=A0A2P9D7A3_PLARE|nr:conserved Plasmodium protein, unknown function [Plasmodium reichenowi]